MLPFLLLRPIEVSFFSHQQIVSHRSCSHQQEDVINMHLLHVTGNVTRPVFKSSFGCGLKKKCFKFLVSNFFIYMGGSGHAAGARVYESWVRGSSASLFQLAVKSTPGSVSMPAWALVSHILQLGLCHHWAPGPSRKPHETECIFK